MNEQSTRSRITIERAAAGDDLDAVRTLMREYADSLPFSLAAQNFEQELAALPGLYAPPAGLLLLARVDGTPAGLIALRPLGDDACEMKRLYVPPLYRGIGLGRLLVDRLVDEARSIGYRAMRLDTMPHLMGPAVALYEAVGFREIPAYWENTLEGVGYMELRL